MILDPVELLERLVAVPSVNPMGRESSDAIFGEARLTDFLGQTFRELGLTTFRQPVLPGRENLIARLDGDVPPERGGRILLFDAHQDTVPVDGMTIDPFRPQRHDGRLYGRGACDTKGGMAAIISAVARLAHERPSPRPTVIVSCTVNEEYGFSGAARFAESWTSGSCPIMPRKPDAAVAAEPTGLDVVVAHKGVIRWKCNARGRAAHSSRPNDGENAIYAIARALTAIEQYAARLAADGPAHPLCGSETLSVGTIRGGVSVNTVPDLATIEIDCRVPPGQEPEAARQALIEHLAVAKNRLPSPFERGAGGEGNVSGQTQTGATAGLSSSASASVPEKHCWTSQQWHPHQDTFLGDTAQTPYPLEHEPPYMSGPALSDGQNGELADVLLRVIGETADGGRKLGVPYATNAAFYAAAGVPSVVFGPGMLAQAHTADEWVSLDQVRQAAEIFHRFCLAFAAPAIKGKSGEAAASR